MFCFASAPKSVDLFSFFFFLWLVDRFVRRICGPMREIGLSATSYVYLYIIYNIY